MESSKRMKTSTTTPKTILDLPSDPQLLILSLLDQKDLCSLSLVSKSFLVLSDHCVRKLTFQTLPNNSTFSKIFTRFSSVEGIVIHSSTCIGRALIAISNSNLNLDALKIVGCPAYPSQQHMISLAGRLKIKSLAFDWFSKVTVDKIIEFIQLFPALEALHFGNKFRFSPGLKDEGVESLSLVVPNLIKIDFSINCHLTDRALYALSANCVNLEYIGMERCYNITSEGICNFLLRSRNLKYLKVPSIPQFSESVILEFRVFSDAAGSFPQFPESVMAAALSACESLHHLSISRTLIRDDTLGTIAKSRAPLTSLQMILYHPEPSSGYTMTGLSAMLCAFQGLTRLYVCLPHPESDNLLDKKMSELVKSLPCLNAIWITSYCPIYATLFSLIENCPLLECINLWIIVPAPNQHYTLPMPQLIRKNYSVKYIRLIPSPVNSEHLRSFCPSLKNWNEPIPIETFFPENPALDWM